MQYLIYSREHEAWWKPAERGYTTDIDQAGRYSREKAAAICEGANKHASTVQEFMHLDPDDELEIEACLRGARHAIRSLLAVRDGISDELLSGLADRIGALTLEESTTPAA